MLNINSWDSCIIYDDNKIEMRKMENDKKENGLKVDEKVQMKRYYVDFYDMFDGWGVFGFLSDRLFGGLDDAIILCDKLNFELDKGNKSCGEHYGVIDGTTNRETHCGQDEEYKQKIFVSKDEKIGGPEQKDRYQEVAEEITHLVKSDLFNSTGFDSTQIENILRKRLGDGFLEECEQKTEKNNMKVPGTNFDIRIENSPEKIEMVAHSAECRYCNGVVKMMRDRKTFELQSDNCSCLMCGQRYYVEILGTIEEWELKQWRQKGQTFAMGGDLSGRGKTVLTADRSENISNE
jgi:hypothetical protein